MSDSGTRTNPAKLPVGLTYRLAAPQALSGLGRLSPKGKTRFGQTPPAITRLYKLPFMSCFYIKAEQGPAFVSHAAISRRRYVPEGTPKEKFVHFRPAPTLAYFSPSFLLNQCPSNSDPLFSGRVSSSSPSPQPVSTVQQFTAHANERKLFGPTK